MSEIISDHKTQGEWKIHLTMIVNFICSKDSKEMRTMHTKSYNIELMISNETDETTEECFDSILQKYQEGLEESMKRNEFVLITLIWLYYKLHKISLNHGG